MRGETLAVVGGQYGSEGKGNIVAHIAEDWDVHVRTGGPNAGHSFQYGGEVFKMQVIPCGWINRDAIIVVGRGALVDLGQLVAELQQILQFDPTIMDRLMIDERAGFLDPRFTFEEGGTKGELHERIGSTGKGVGAARHARMSRDPEQFQLIGDIPDTLEALSETLPQSLLCNLHPDTPLLLRHYRENGLRTLLEGTQGSGLSLIHGPWPYVTSSDTNAAEFAAEAGVPPQFVTEVGLVIRTYPIRVAGNSGPLEDELTWDEMSSRVGKDVVEKTTVTQKVRRIGEWDEDLVRRAVTLNGPSWFAVNFIDYLSPEDEGVTDAADLSDRAMSFVNYLETNFRVPVRYVGTGGEGWKVVTRD